MLGKYTIALPSPGWNLPYKSKSKPWPRIEGYHCNLRNQPRRCFWSLRAACRAAAVWVGFCRSRFRLFALHYCPVRHQAVNLVAGKRLSAFKQGKLLSTVCLNSAMRLGVAEAPRGLMAFCGSINTPFWRRRKSRCGPVESPVLPTKPITCPWRTFGAFFSGPLAKPERWAYIDPRPANMANYNLVAVTAAPAALCNHAFANCLYRRSCRRAVINAKMRSCLAQNGMFAVVGKRDVILVNASGDCKSVFLRFSPLRL